MSLRRSCGTSPPQKPAELSHCGRCPAISVRQASAAAAQSWRGLTAETKGSDFKRVRESDTRISVFASHPLGAQRIASLDAQAATLKAGGDRGHDRHRAAIRPFLSAWLRGQAMCSLALILYYAVGLSLVGLELALIVGMATGMLSFIP